MTVDVVVRGAEAVSAGPDGLVELTGSQIERFWRDGFLSIERLTSETDVSLLCESYDRLFSADSDVDAEDQVELAGSPGTASTLPQVMNPDRYLPELRDSLACRNATAISRQLLGNEAVPVGMHAICKPPRDGAETPWHQDEAYWDPGFDHRALSVWIPLQPATMTNGCMQFADGTGDSKVRPHSRIDEASHGLAAVDVSDIETGTACPLPAGGATIHFCRTLHYAGRNTSDEPRRALVMGFAVPGVPLATPRSFPWQLPTASMQDGAADLTRDSPTEASAGRRD